MANGTRRRGWIRGKREQEKTLDSGSLSRASAWTRAVFAGRQKMDRKWCHNRSILTAILKIPPPASVPLPIPLPQKQSSKLLALLRVRHKKSKRWQGCGTPVQSQGISLSCALIGPQGSNHALDVLFRNLDGKTAAVKCALAAFNSFGNKQLRVNADLYYRKLTRAWSNLKVLI